MYIMFQNAITTDSFRNPVTVILTTYLKNVFVTSIKYTLLATSYINYMINISKPTSDDFCVLLKTRERYKDAVYHHFH